MDDVVGRNAHIARCIKRRKTGIIIAFRFFDDAKHCRAGGLEDALERWEHPLAYGHLGFECGLGVYLFLRVMAMDDAFKWLFWYDSAFLLS